MSGWSGNSDDGRPGQLPRRPAAGGTRPAASVREPDTRPRAGHRAEVDVIEHRARALETLGWADELQDHRRVTVGVGSQPQCVGHLFRVAEVVTAAVEGEPDQFELAVAQDHSVVGQPATLELGLLALQHLEVRHPDQAVEREDHAGHGRREQVQHQAREQQRGDGY